ncbi:phosphodiester glycosidase family protein [Paenibacillus sp. GCM10012307]|uniref:Phosphodiester glycosidase family protein n=1 Tax=Paenibacillus roseus TaxID=2798579 RepID=A0A934MQG1_9BACL|nr:phosphodiester glycosidase family protein [Paenibacillus roseus]MBJ6361853.1 phosphodiester glycosidase family protein [Paenibacillus roseus]
MRKTVLAIILFCAAGMALPHVSEAASNNTKNFGYLDTKTNSTFVPIRFLSEYAGASVKWTAVQQRVDITKGEDHITLYAGSTSASINNEELRLDAPPFESDGSTYVPLRFVSQALGIQLSWQSDISSVNVAAGGKQTRLPVIKRGTLTEPVNSQVQTFKVGGKSFTVRVVTVNLMHPKVQLDIALAHNTVGKVEELSSIAKRNEARIAINGTFFDAYTDDSYKTPYGWIVQGGKIKKHSSGDRKTVFIYDANNLSELVAGVEFPERYKQGGIEGALQVGPRLVVNGKVSLNVKEEGFRDPKILTGGGARSALGITSNHQLLLVTSSGATIPQMAEIMKQAGSYQAMNLDGGASSGLYYNGSYLTPPGRQISNALLIKY